ncbi:DAK2 domain-containing protein [uncultured Flavonifractor sp.]|uniref:DAK2 domain-containing protein n=1 Tax=uncultured Flavonifractor sp. TaxID=1193534 RepID=UPI00174802E7|nr:DAK2 domain-containing protein [uncultured Flavonifractor sp.]
MRESIDGASFAQAVIHAAASLNLRKQEINELNVFPVPDGDTGTNMSLTIGTAATELRKKQPRTVGEAASTTASALLRGARGNSGVILSLLFRGLSKAVKDKDTIDGRDLAIALDFGVAAAYKAVMKPAEGTILTVSRLAAAKAADAARQTPNDPEAVLAAAIAEGQLALEHTTEMNPVLKKAGVVDAGGKGFLVILQGMLDSLRGEPMPEEEGGSGAASEQKTDYAAIAAEEITFTFDTVFIVRKTDPHKGLEAFEAYLNSIGDSLVIGEDDDCFKVHVHTDIPGAALTEAQKYGTLELAKIENMRTQAEDLAAGRHIQSTDDLDAVEAELEGEPAPGGRKIAAPEKKYGVVAVAAGDGLAAVFKDLGADGVISGGQTMNPSTDDILREIDATPAEIVFVLPNNKNIIMAAEQCIRLVEGKQVVVLPTKTVPQGISALMVMDPEADTEANVQAMQEALSRVHTSEITYAARDSDFDGFAIKRGDYLALTEHQLFGTDRKVEKLLRRLAEADDQQNAEFINIFYGEDVTEREAQKALKLFTECCPNAEITLLSGGQPVYYYMISAE